LRDKSLISAVNKLAAEAVCTDGSWWGESRAALWQW